MKSRPIVLLLCVFALAARAQGSLPGAQSLTLAGDPSAQMVAGIDRFLDRQTELAATERGRFWKRDLSSADALEKSTAPNRERLRTIIGAVDPRLPVRALEFTGDTATPAKLADAPGYEVFAVRWPVFDGVWGEGLFLRPKGNAVAGIVAIPDADQTPELLAGLVPGLPPENQIARRLAERGCRVLVPVLVSRDVTWSGIPGKPASLPHREWIYRQAYEVGRHVIGYEVQKIFAAVDWLVAQGGPVGVSGYGEGGLIALHAAALDPRIGATLVSGYFDSRQRLWSEPIDRNVVSLLREFGDAEIATLIAPRALLVEHSAMPRVEGSPAPAPGRRNIAAPGRIATPELAVVRSEFERARALVGEKLRGGFLLVEAGALAAPFSERAQTALLIALGVPVPIAAKSPPAPAVLGAVDGAERQRRQVKQLEEHTQRLVRASEAKRQERFWTPIKATNAAAWSEARPRLKQQLWEDVLGKFPPASLPANPRARRVGETDAFVTHEVVLDVWPDVFAWGLLLVPKNLAPGERRPVVVCQHGLEGLPADCVTQDPTTRAFQYYKGFAATLAERGFITFAPHNPYRGGDAFRVLQRKANPLGRSLFSVILAQHERILDWLSALPFVDPARIGFYGLSYGGKTAMRVPALLDRYCLSICSADFNEWVRKNAATDYPSSYLFTGEYEIFEWDLGHTFNYAEMAALIAPRPFMVERGHRDGVGTDEWVSYEFAKVRRFYTRLGVADRAEIEYFDGPHTINGQGTFEFLHRHLNWPKPAVTSAAPRR
ncbi:MAG: dienelactone hydrolase family protein [Opitutaceae bacterium]|nr:dienelactone hydrolase family protein [Opitutaceae bacterium]